MIGRPSPSGRVVPCRQCGAPTELEAWALEHARMFDRVLRKRGLAPLADDELVICGAPACRAAEDEDFARRGASPATGGGSREPWE